MVNQGSTAGTPRYAGPTAAERFADDMAAVRSLQRHDLPRPPQLELAAITSRYPATSVHEDDEGLPVHVGFMDGSAVHRIGSRWEVA
jgi:hypothetical protein